VHFYLPILTTPFTIWSCVLSERTMWHSNEIALLFTRVSRSCYYIYVRVIRGHIARTRNHTCVYYETHVAVLARSMIVLRFGRTRNPRAVRFALSHTRWLVRIVRAQIYTRKTGISEMRSQSVWVTYTAAYGVRKYPTGRPRACSSTEFLNYKMHNVHDNTPDKWWQSIVKTTRAHV